MGSPCSSFLVHASSMVLSISILYSTSFSFVSLTCPATTSVECTSTGVEAPIQHSSCHFDSTTSSTTSINSCSSKTTPNACSTEPESQQPPGPAGIHWGNNMPYLCCGDSGDQPAIWEDSSRSPTSSPRGRGKQIGK